MLPSLPAYGCVCRRAHSLTLAAALTAILLDVARCCSLSKFNFGFRHLNAAQRTKSHKKKKNAGETNQNKMAKASVCVGGIFRSRTRFMCRPFAAQRCGVDIVIKILLL